MSERHAALTSLPPILPRLIRRFAVVIVLLWLGFTAFVNLAVPQLEVVGKAHSVSIEPQRRRIDSGDQARWSGVR